MEEKSERQITIIFDRDDIIRAECGVPKCGGHFDYSYSRGTKNICRHLLAVMFLLDEY